MSVCTWYPGILSTGGLTYVLEYLLGLYRKVRGSTGQVCLKLHLKKEHTEEYKLLEQEEKKKKEREIKKSKSKTTSITFTTTKLDRHYKTKENV